MWVVKMYVLRRIFSFSCQIIFVFRVWPFFPFLAAAAATGFNDDLHLRLIFLQHTRFFFPFIYYFPFFEDF